MRSPGHWSKPLAAVIAPCPRCARRRMQPKSLPRPIRHRRPTGGHPTADGGIAAMVALRPLVSQPPELSFWQRADPAGGWSIRPPYSSPRPIMPSEATGWPTHGPWIRSRPRRPTGTGCRGIHFFLKARRPQPDRRVRRRLTMLFAPFSRMEFRRRVLSGGDVIYRVPEPGENSGGRGSKHPWRGHGPS